MLKRLAVLCFLTICLMSVAHGALTDNLVSYYKLDNSTDSLGTNNGTPTQMLFSSAYGKIGSGANSPNATSIINLGNGASLNINGNLTISAWVNITATTGDSWYVAKFSTSAPYTQYALGNLASGVVNFNIRNSAGSSFNANISLNGTNKWHHVVGVIAGTTMSVYVDNVKGTDVTFTGTRGTVTTNAAIGGRVSDNYGRILGNVDEVAIYNRALSASEISQLYASGSGLQYPFTTSTCTYSGSGQWNINIADNCTLNTATQLNNTLRIYGTGGTLNVNASIQASRIHREPSAFTGNFIIRVMTTAGAMLGVYK